MDSLSVFQKRLLLDPAIPLAAGTVSQKILALVRRPQRQCHLPEVRVTQHPRRNSGHRQHNTLSDPGPAFWKRILWMAKLGQKLEGLI
jgi:hypothetical protein